MRDVYDVRNVRDVSPLLVSKLQFPHHPSLSLSLSMCAINAPSIVRDYDYDRACDVHFVIALKGMQSLPFEESAPHCADVVVIDVAAVVNKMLCITI